MGEVHTAALWDGVEEPGELVVGYDSGGPEGDHSAITILDRETGGLVWHTTLRPLGSVEIRQRVAEILDELSGVGPQRRVWACYGRLEPWGP